MEFKNLPDKRYSIIYIDPPYPFKVWNKKDGGRTASSHYNTILFSDLLEFPMSDITNDDCALFIWCPCSYVRGAFELAENWGFKYKTVAFIWVKRNKNSGNFLGNGALD